MEKDKGCKITKPDKIGVENLHNRKINLCYAYKIRLFN